MKNVWIRPLAMAVLALAACKSDRVTGVTSETETGELAGILVFEGGKPAEGAEVILAPADSLSALKKSSALSAEATTTDAKGRYSFKALDSGTYHISASLKQGNDTLVAYRFNIRFKNKLFVGTDTLVDPGKIEVKVLLGGKPAEKVYCYVPGTSYIAISDKDGLCIISGIEPGTYDVAFLHSAYAADDVKQVKVLPGSRISLKDADLHVDPTKAPPAPAGLSSEYDKSTGLVTLRWGGVPVSDLAGYILYRDTAGAVLQSRLTTGYLVQDTNYQDAVYGDLQDTSARNLQYKIQAQDKDGNASLFAAFPALKVTRPNLPAAPNPANGSTGTSAAPTLSWAQVSGSIVSYAVYLGTESVPDSAVGTSLTTASVKVSGLKKSTRYYWRVTASVGGVKAAGPIWSFTTGTADLPQDTGLVAYWDFNEGSGTKFADKTGSGNDGTLSGASWAEGIESAGLRFDGVDDKAVTLDAGKLHMGCGISSDPACGFTFSTWLKPESDSGHVFAKEGYANGGGRFSGLGAWQVYLLKGKANLFVQFNGTSRTVTTDSTLGLNAWHLLSITYDGTFRIYLDGVENGNTSTYARHLAHANDSGAGHIGSRINNSDYFKGTLDRMKVFNRAQTASRIKEEWDSYKFQQTVATQYQFVKKWGDNPPQYVFHSLTGLATDGVDNLYAVSFWGDSVCKFDSAGKWLASWSEPPGSPRGIDVDKKNDWVYVTNAGGFITKHDGQGKLLATWGTGKIDSGLFKSPFSVAVDQRNGNVFVADQGSNRIHKLDTAGKVLTTWGSAGTGPGQFGGNLGVAVDSKGLVYVHERGSTRIQKFDNEGNFMLQWPVHDGRTQGDGISIGPDDHIFVVEYYDSSRVVKYSPEGKQVSAWGKKGEGNGEFLEPSDVVVDSKGNVYTSEWAGNRVQKFAPK